MTRAASGIDHFDELIEMARTRSPGRRLVDIAEVGRVVAFLVGGAASRHDRRRHLRRRRPAPWPDKVSTPRTNTPLDADLIDPALRLEAELDALNTRIARLALLLHAPLGDADGLHRIMERDPAFFPVHPVASAVEAGRASGHRLAHEWEELRGLIVLRYELIVQAVRGLRGRADPADGLRGREGSRAAGLRSRVRRF